MARTSDLLQGPAGGLHAGRRTLRRWRWQDGHALRCAPLRCRRAEWYGVRAIVRHDRPEPTTAVLRFYAGGVEIAHRCLALEPPASGPQRFGWFKTPADADALLVELDAAAAHGAAALDVYPVAERTPKCHPLANVPAWSTYKPPFSPDRLLLPASLSSVRSVLDDALPVATLAAPRSLKELVAAISGGAAVLDTAWAAALRLSLRDLQRLASVSWLIIDLDTFAAAINAAGVAETRIMAVRGLCESLGARVAFSDVATRGFALQDVFPWGVVDEAGRFSLRCLATTRSFRRWADEAGVAPLLETVGPADRHCEQILSAAWAVGMGELIATDLPWLIAGDAADRVAAAAREPQTRAGGLNGAPQHRVEAAAAIKPAPRATLAAPRAAAHALRMHLCGRLDDAAQYWNRWDDTRVVVRDVADLARRYPMLRPVRWASDDSRVVRLGVALAPGTAARPRRHFMIRTGRIDLLEPHDGIPPEAMMIFVKQLARDLRSGDAWAGRALADAALTWQFDTAEGLRYATLFDAAGAELPPPAATLVVRAAPADAERVTTGGRASGDNGAAMRRVALPIGLMSDGSVEFQAGLDRMLREWIAACTHAGERLSASGGA